MKPIEINNETGIELSVQRSIDAESSECDSIVLLAEHVTEDICDNGCLPIMMSKEDARKLAVTLLELAKD